MLPHGTEHSPLVIYRFLFLPLSIASKCTVELRAASVAYTDSGVRTQDWKRKEEAAR